MTGAYVGVDVGGTKVAVGVLRAGALGELHVEPTTHAGADDLIEQLVRVIEQFRAPDVRAIGLGVPSIVDFETGWIRNSVNIPLVDVQLRRLLTERLGLPVYVDNDANCAALAEAYDGDRLVSPQLVMLTVGTGVGGGLVLNGRLFRGATGAAPEIGHTMVAADLDGGVPDQVGWPMSGSLEAVASGSALDRLALEAARAHPESPLGRVLASGGAVSGREAVAEARGGDPVARSVVETLGRRLGIGIANAINTFDPLEVVIGGGVSAAGELLLGPARDTAARYTVPGVGTRTQIRLARYGPEAGVLGAARIAAQEEDSE